MPKIRISPLPYKNKGKLYFPTGEFDGWFTFPEIRKALEIGGKILNCYEAAVFKPVRGMFSRYIDAMFDLKKTKSTKIMGKLMMNGLSGKYGQQLHDDSGYHIVEDTDDIVIDHVRYFSMGGLIYEFIKPDLDAEIEFISTAYPMIIAYITAYARLQLYTVMEDIGLEYITYIDTDSIHADSNAISAAIVRGDIIIHDTELGAWSLDYQNRTIEIRGLKYYRVRRADTDDPDGAIEWHYKIRGVSSKNQRHHWREHRSWTTRVRKIRTALRYGGRINEFISLPRVDGDENPKREFILRDSYAFSII